MKKKASNPVEKQETPADPGVCGWCNRPTPWGASCERCTAAMSLETPIGAILPRFGWLVVKLRLDLKTMAPWTAPKTVGTSGTGLNECWMGLIVNAGRLEAGAFEPPINVGDWVLFDPFKWARPGITSVHGDERHVFVPQHAILGRLLI